jgi:bifunctional aspartokinase / homoserine dehydrogenase 1
VAGELLKQIRGQKARLLESRVDLRVCSVSNSKATLLDLAGLPLEEMDWRAELAKNPPHLDMNDLLARIRGADLMNTVLVDATTDDSVASSYVPFLESGIHVVTPNKKANTMGMDYYRRLRTAANRGRVRFHYETTVGAGLPLIDTLQNLLKCGDRLVTFEGILSGSLSFICGLLEDGAPFSEAVERARALGYTEPDPRDDLSGKDVARKLLILARESGLDLEIEDIQVQGMLPSELAAGGSVIEFVAGLRDFDSMIQSRVAAAKKAGSVLRYLGSIRDGRCHVGLQEVPAASPLSAVREGENIASFLTERYRPVPLVVRGYGAGPVVTATGVFSDILRLVWFHH